MLSRLVRLLPGFIMGKHRSKGGYYAVRVGRSTGVFNSWEECQQAVNGFSGARFKKFDSHEEAADFVGGSDYGSSSASSHSSNDATCPHYTRPAKYTSSGCSVDKPRNNFKRTTRTTQYLDHVPSISLSSISESSSSGTSGCAVVYSDGCCTSNGRYGAKAGIGVYWGAGSKNNISERLHGPQTNQRAEIVAACRAIESAKNLGYKSVEVRTDSKYTINGATGWLRKWKSNGWKTVNNTDVKNVDDFKKLDEICQTMDVKWTHVPGHSGHHGNEMADSLAKAGSSLSK